MESKGVARIRIVMAVDGKELQLPDYVKDKRKGAETAK